MRYLSCERYCLTQIQVFSGNMQDAHAHLAESETLIRTYGLPKRIKSQKVLKLHHIFSFLRIIEESTSLGTSESNSEVNRFVKGVCTVGCQSNFGTALAAGSPLSPSTNSRLDWAQDEDLDYLEEDSLFISIYQMPTSLMSLLSQTSSLWKQLQVRKRCHHSFDGRAKLSRIAFSDGKNQRS